MNPEAKAPLAGAAGSVDWRSIADDLASALRRLDALYLSEQDAAAPTNRPEWLRRPLQRYHCALGDTPNPPLAEAAGSALSVSQQELVNAMHAQPGWRLIRLQGGYWVLGDGVQNPGSVVGWMGGTPRCKYWGTTTVHALIRKGLLSGSPWGPVSLSPNTPAQPRREEGQQ